LPNVNVFEAIELKFDIQIPLGIAKACGDILQNLFSVKPIKLIYS